MASTVREGTQVVFAPLALNITYPDECLRIASSWQVGAGTAVEALKEKDTITRATMCQKMRAGMPQGEALKAAIDEHAIEWKTRPVGNALKRQEAPDGWNGDNRGGRKPKKQKGEQAGKGGGKQTSRKILNAKYYNGWEVCKAYNDVRGCPGKKCSQNRHHGCDADIGGGKACGSKQHTRAGHPNPRLVQ